MPTRNYTNSANVTSRTRDILSNRLWYGDDSPDWWPGDGEIPAPTRDEVSDQQTQLVHRLQRNDNPAALPIADRLASCSPRHPCASGGCPVCLRAYGRWFVSSSTAYLAEYLTELKTEALVVSLVHPDLQVPITDLAAAHFTHAKRKITDLLKESGITTFVGGVDISANEDDPNLNATRHAANVPPVQELLPHWQIQAWFLAATEEVDAAEPKLRSLFPRSESVPRPVKIQPWDGDATALAYALKSQFVRRVRYFRPPTPDRHGCLNTRDRSLRVEQQLHLTISLDRAGLHARLLLGSCRVVQTEHGPMIRPISR